MELLVGSGPLYRRLTEGLKKAILKGTFRPGERLPSTRNLAQDLGISRNTVVEAYEQLIAEGYLTTGVGSGTFVASALSENFAGVFPEREIEGGFPLGKNLSAFALRADIPKSFESRPKTRGLKFDFQYGHVIPDQLTKKQLSRHLRECLYKQDFDYGDVRGFPGLREEISRYLFRVRGLSVKPEEVLIVNGAQQGLEILTRALLNPGDSVAIEEPHYQGARELFLTSGAKLIPCPLDRDGVIPGRLPGNEKGLKLLHLTPSHQFPTGAVLPLARRLEILEWAQKEGVIIIEDDYDSEYRYQTRPVSPLKNLDREGNVVYLGTFAKALFPGLRLGYVIAPLELRRVLTKIKWLSDRGSSVPFQVALADFLKRGGYDRHIRRTARFYSKNHAVLISELKRTFGDEIIVSGSAAGLHLMVLFKKLAAAKIPQLIEMCRENGVGVYPIDQYFLNPQAQSGILLGFGTIATKNIVPGIKILRQNYCELLAGEKRD